MSTYRCPVCRVADETAYLRCHHGGCPDGRDPRPAKAKPLYDNITQCGGTEQWSPSGNPLNPEPTAPIAFTNRGQFQLFGRGAIDSRPSDYLDMPLYAKPYVPVPFRIYVDLDGVMADFDRRFQKLFGVMPSDYPEQSMWDVINAHPSFFREMPACKGAISFFREIEHLDPIVLTACPKTNYQHAATQKREWVRERLGDHVIVLPVMGGHNKPLFMHRPKDILIDDMNKNIRAWENAGGIGILHSDFEKTSATLKAILADHHDYKEIDRAAS